MPTPHQVRPISQAGKSSSPGAFRVEVACDFDHVVRVVVGGQPGAQEDPPYVYVVGDVAAGELPHRDAEVAGEDLDGHRGLLLPDAVEAA
jgi:hypothetical protein